MTQWYYGSPAGQSGPVDERQLREMIAAGQLAPETLVWRDGMKDWARVDALPELSSMPVASYGPPQPGGYPAYYPVAPPTSGLAIASMVCGILAIVTCYIHAIFGIPAVICGHMALSAIRQAPLPMAGRGMAIAGLVTGYLGIVFSICTVIFFVVVFSQAASYPSHP